MSVSSLGSLGALFPTSLLRQNTTPAEFTRLDGPEKTPAEPSRSFEEGLGLEALQSQANIFQAVNFSASRTDFQAQGDGFALNGFTEQLNFSAQLQQGDQLLQLNIQVQRSAVSVALGPKAGESGFDVSSLLDRLPDDARSLVESFSRGEKSADFFSPESTAGRILDFALGGFSFFEGGLAADENSAESRQRFVDYIAPAINKGFQEALDILGALPDSIAQELNKTRSLLDDGLAQFVQESPLQQEA